MSYSHKDSAYAHRLANELSQWGIEAWIDDRIDYGTNWPRVIQDSLNACPAFIVIMSTNAYKSDWVQNEVSYAQGKGKAIFPIRLDGDVWVSLAARQYFDGQGGKLPPRDFYIRLQRTLGIKQPFPGSVMDELGLNWDTTKKEMGLDRESFLKGFLGSSDKAADSDNSDIMKQIRKNWNIEDDNHKD